VVENWTCLGAIEAVSTKRFLGLMKILYPQGGATKAEVKDVLRTAIEGRKRVKDQLLRIDCTYPEARFAYEGKDGQENLIHTLEKDEYPN
jgi:ATP-dependent Lon protease